MRLPIETLKRDSLDIWHATSSGSPDLGPGFSTKERLHKEEEIDLLMDQTDRSIRDVKNASAEVRQRLVAVRGRVQKSMIQLLHGFECVIDDEMERSFSRAMDDFIRQAYDFDQEISRDDVYQASRNVLIMNTVQMHLGMEVAVTPSVFAYSMIYPYTDNYLDAADISGKDKLDANRRLRLRLAGIKQPAHDAREEKIDALVDMVEKEFDRGRYPLVYESLQAIHAAQCRSVSQQGTERLLPEKDLLAISIEKGGTSVLADGYLVAGELADEDASFLFRFGVLLQLIDDLQDLEEDASRTHFTLAGVAARNGCAEAFTNRLFSFRLGVLGPSPVHQQRLRRLIDRSCRLLLFESVAAHSEYYGAEYRSNLEEHSPVRLCYLRSMKKRLERVRDARQNEMGGQRTPSGFHVPKPEGVARPHTLHTQPARYSDRMTESLTESATSSSR